MKLSLGTASAPAKVILFGEHFVVYGNPAILAAINKRVTAAARTLDDSRIIITSDIGAAAEYSGSKFTLLRGGKSARTVLDPIYDAVKRCQRANKMKSGLKLDLRSEVPYGIGLGSSAASCVAAVGAVDSISGRHGRRWVCELAVKSEKMIHRNSSGADCYVSAIGGMITYSKKEGFRKLVPKRALSLVVGNTGARHSTGELVASVARFRKRNMVLFRTLAKRAEEISQKALTAIRLGDVEQLGRLMNENQLLLQNIGVTHRTNRLINTCIRAGALGAKITGAGGGGAVIALAATRKQGAMIAASIRASGCESMEVTVDMKGLIH